MENSMIENLKDKISTEPSVLVLGQDYLSSKTGKNAFYDLANKMLCNGVLPSTTDYTELWKHINDGEALDAVSFEKIREIVSRIPEQNWLRSILNMRWGMVMTSAIDSALYQCVGDNFSIQPIDMDQKYFERKYISKRTLNISFLYGTIDGTGNSYPPKECTNKAFMKARKRANDRINWIYNDILSEYGVLVIDGWNPEYDWMSTLLENAGDMPYGSIFLFGANKDVLQNEDVCSLSESGILQADPRSFAQALEEIGFFEDTTEDIERGGNDNSRTITIRYNSSMASLSVPFDEIARLDTHITVLYDDIWHANTDIKLDPQVLYAKFQQQTAMPVWYLYDNRYGFYFNRTQDQKLKEIVEGELRSNSYKRKCVILEGNSNVGKTASLVHLAYIERNTAPIIYISGEPSQLEWMDQLKEFIKNQLVEWQNRGKKISCILVIWDANTDYNAVQRCKQLQDILRECNAVVVGSAYPLSQDRGDETYYKDKGKNHHIILSAKLCKDEIKEMLESVKNVNMQMYESMCKCVDKRSAHLLNVLQNIIHLQYRDEWRLVSDALMIRFNQEVAINEDYVQTKIIEYEDDLANRVDEEIHKYGVAAAWQLKLAQIKKELWGSETVDEEKQEKLIAYTRMEKHIQKLNGILSVAGEFSVFIPLTLILRMMSTVEQQILSDEQVFLINIIEKDSLLSRRRDEQGYVSVSFRHRTEAEMYIENNFGNTSDERKGKEVEFLKAMIKEGKWHDEQENTPLLMLVRSFGPNSWGKLSAPRGKDRHYTEYEKWWLDIAACLKDEIENQPEGILVYALFVRSHCRKEIDKIEINQDLSAQEQASRVRQQLDMLNEAKKMLRDAIDQHDQNNKSQLCRLLGEMCSNLVYEMKKSEEDENVIRNQFQQLKDYFARAVSNWSENSAQNMFTKNALLDIWVNGVENYFEKKGKKEDLMKNQECVEIVADSINYIDELLDLTEDNFENTKLLSKVEEIYKYAGEDTLKILQDKIDRCNNDTYLYLKAWQCWDMQEEIAFGNAEERDLLKNYTRNLYLIPDDFDRLEISKGTASKLKKYAQRAASQALDILNEKKRLIENTRSIRCILMMIRAKWLLYTGNMPLETKQQPALTINQWNEIGELCRKYIIYADHRGEKLRDTPVFLRMMYVWCFTKDGKAFENLQNRQNMLKTNEWYFERVCLCNVGTKTPKLFKVNLQPRKGTKNKYNATIVAPVEGVNDEIENNVKNRQVHVPDSVAQELMGKGIGDAKFNINQPVLVWFNAKGPQIGLPEKGDQ